MDAARDLGRTEPWQESLERSLARRPAPARPRARRRRAAPARPRASARKTTGSRRLVTGAGGICALAFLVGVVALAGGGTRPARVARTLTVAAPKAPADGGPSDPSGALSSAVAPGGSRSCRAVNGSRDYINPLAGARVTPERIDQGVDYAGTGTLAAIGAATVTHVATAGTGWPGSFIEYRLLDGPDAGCYVYYAEGVNPMPHLHAGQVVAPGEPIATIIPGWSSGIELGWGAGNHNMTYAAIRRQWSTNGDNSNAATEAGKSFSALIASLGGKPGKVEG